ncbi:Uncharacterised protein [uncultured archaeon]|nr:Uncharacterised protein [uncultured archaeon]
MDLTGRVQGFMAMKLKSFSVELAEKYGVPENEVADVVGSFLEDTYWPAQKLAEVISCKKNPVLLFIGKKDCPICQRCQVDLDAFLSSHKDLELIRVDYTTPEGLLYHMIQQQDTGKLPMIAMIYGGMITMFITGECIHSAVYEKYYNALRMQGSQNIYAL